MVDDKVTLGIGMEHALLGNRTFSHQGERCFWLRRRSISRHSRVTRARNILRLSLLRGYPKPCLAVPLHCAPSGCPAQNSGPVDRWSFLHSLLHAGLSRRPGCSFLRYWGQRSKPTQKRGGLSYFVGLL